MFSHTGLTLEEQENKRRKQAETKAYYREKRRIDEEREKQKRKIDEQTPCGFYKKHGKCNFVSSFIYDSSISLNTANMYS